MGAVINPRVAPSGPPGGEEPQQTNPVRKLSFYFGLAFILVVFGVVPELAFYFTGHNTYLIYWVAPIAILGALITGGIRRTFQHRAACISDRFVLRRM